MSGMLRGAFCFRLRLGGLTLAASLALARALGLPKEGNLVLDGGARQRHRAAVMFRLAGQAVVTELEAVVNRYPLLPPAPKNIRFQVKHIIALRIQAVDKTLELRASSVPTNQNFTSLDSATSKAPSVGVCVILPLKEIRRC